MRELDVLLIGNVDIAETYNTVLEPDFSYFGDILSIVVVEVKAYDVRADTTAIRDCRDLVFGQHVPVPHQLKVTICA